MIWTDLFQDHVQWQLDVELFGMIARALLPADM